MRMFRFLFLLLSLLIAVMVELPPIVMPTFEYDGGRWLGRVQWTLESGPGQVEEGNGCDELGF
jgi:hypothetical protein